MYTCICLEECLQLGVTLIAFQKLNCKNGGRWIRPNFARIHGLLRRGAKDVVAEPRLRRSRSVVLLPRRRVMRACYAPPRAAQRFSFCGFWSIGKKEMTTGQPSARVQPKERFS